MDPLKLRGSFFVFILIFFIGSNSTSNLGFTGRPITSLECPNCKCTFDNPCTYKQISLYRNKGIEIIPSYSPIPIMCNMDIIDINLDRLHFTD